LRAARWPQHSRLAGPSSLLWRGSAGDAADPGGGRSRSPRCQARGRRLQSNARRRPASTSTDEPRRNDAGRRFEKPGRPRSPAKPDHLIAFLRRAFDRGHFPSAGRLASDCIARMDFCARMVAPRDLAGTEGMNPERWQHVKQVLNGALALENVEQPAYLDEACSGDPDLRAEVETLLQHHQQAESGFLGRTGLVLQMPGGAADRPVPRVGRRVGVYQLLEEIGQGGMGEVYRAARIDGQYEKQVAVKLVRGGFDTASVLERFRHERQILASLDHPNIARLLDGGTTEEGIPYLVMELIEGTPIDQYCNTHELNVTERLRLFLQVCSAVQYAHQRLVIHRDIKPGNILVTRDGIPKLLDF